MNDQREHTDTTLETAYLASRAWAEAETSNMPAEQVRGLRAARTTAVDTAFHAGHNDGRVIGLALAGTLWSQDPDAADEREFYGYGRAPWRWNGPGKYTSTHESEGSTPMTNSEHQNNPPATAVAFDAAMIDQRLHTAIEAGDDPALTAIAADLEAAGAPLLALLLTRGDSAAGLRATLDELRATHIRESRPAATRVQLARETADTLAALTPSTHTQRHGLRQRLIDAGIRHGMHFEDMGPSRMKSISITHGFDGRYILDGRDILDSTAHILDTSAHNLAALRSQLATTDSWPLDKRIEFQLGQLLFRLDRSPTSILEPEGTDQAALTEFRNDLLALVNDNATPPPADATALDAATLGSHARIPDSAPPMVGEFPTTATGSDQTQLGGECTT